MADSLIEAFDNEHFSVRWMAVESLVKIKPESAVESLIVVLRDEDWEVRLWTIDALHKISTPEALKAVEEFQ